MREFFKSEYLSILLIISNLIICVWFYLMIDRSEKFLKKCKNQIDAEMNSNLTIED